MIRVLVVEDSAVTREYLVYLLRQDPAIEVVGNAWNGLEAVEQTERLKPDVILMDVHMPGMNGYEATRQIMARQPTPIVMVSASLMRDEVIMTFQALEAGALTILEKPVGPGHPDAVEAARRLLEMLKLMAEVKVIRRRPLPESPVVSVPTSAVSDRKVRLIAVGASTGGPQVLATLLSGLPADLAASILVVQHIALGFLPGMVEWLGQGTRLTVKLAEPAESVRPGTVYLAPDGVQMGIARDGRIRLMKEPGEEGFCPSASYLFHSVAESYGPSACGILLTGMGRDGAVGLKRLRAAGGVTIAQDEASSVVFGMPAEAIRLGAAEYVLSPEQIAATIRSLMNSR